jgi:hypothetical protein
MLFTVRMLLNRYITQQMHCITDCICLNVYRVLIVKTCAV